MKIAICDDDYGICKELESILQMVLQEPNAICLYNEGEGLLKDFSNGYVFDIIYLDIELPGLNGMEVGQVLREQVEKQNLDLIFISQKSSYCEQLFDLEPRRFYRKPFDREKIIKDLKILIKEHTEHRQSVWYEEDGREYRLFLQDVLYMEAESKKITVYDKNGNKIVLKKTLKEWEEAFRKEHFVRCHRSFLVNLNYVKAYSRKEFEMINDAKVPIGRKYEKATREIWNLHKMEEEE